jgi:hypothetical protein
MYKFLENVHLHFSDQAASLETRPTSPLYEHLCYAFLDKLFFEVKVMYLSAKVM